MADDDLAENLEPLFSRSVGCHRSGRRTNAQADQTGSRFEVNGGVSHGKQGHPANTPRFQPPPPWASCRPLGVSPVGNQSARVRPARQGGRRRICVELGNSWRWKWLLEGLQACKSTLWVPEFRIKTEHTFTFASPNSHIFLRNLFRQEGANVLYSW